jgi:ATP/maltotriose-dependent transcriptional regulator MalT
MSQAVAADGPVVLETKVTPPVHRPGLIVRGDLIGRMVDASAPVVAVSAPVGYGKTTLVMQYAAAAERPVAWVSLDAADDDLGLLLVEVGAARRELARYPDAGILPRLLAREERALEAARGGQGVLREPLTDAEQRVLALLPTHLTVEEIGRSLHVSRNTVKGPLRAIYRKLDAGSRADAVARARALGLDRRPGDR